MHIDIFLSYKFLKRPCKPYQFVDDVDCLIPAPRNFYALIIPSDQNYQIQDKNYYVLQNHIKYW